MNNTEVEIRNNLNLSKEKLNDLKINLNELISDIEKSIENDLKVSKNSFNKIKTVINKITDAHENYASLYSKNETINNDSIKRNERIKNIDIELENWKSLKKATQKE